MDLGGLLPQTTHNLLGFYFKTGPLNLLLRKGNKMKNHVFSMKFIYRVTMARNRCIEIFRIKMTKKQCTVINTDSLLLFQPSSDVVSTSYDAESVNTRQKKFLWCEEFQEELLVSNRKWSWCCGRRWKGRNGIHSQKLLFLQNVHSNSVNEDLSRFLSRANKFFPDCPGKHDFSNGSVKRIVLFSQMTDFDTVRVLLTMSPYSGHSLVNPIISGTNHCEGNRIAIISCWYPSHREINSTISPYTTPMWWLWQEEQLPLQITHNAERGLAMWSRGDLDPTKL